MLTGTVIGISDTEITLDLRSYSEGIIPAQEMSNDPRFSLKADVTMGEDITAVIIGETRDGAILLSKKQAEDVITSYSIHYTKLYEEDFSEENIKQLEITKRYKNHKLESCLSMLVRDILKYKNTP